MSQSTSTVWFEVYPAYGKPTSWQVERCPTDSLSDLLEKLSQQTNISVEELFFTFQFEYGKLEGKDLRYFTKSKQRIYKENGSVEWKTVYANNDNIKSPEDLSPRLLVGTNYLISELDDVSCPQELAPVISIDLRTVFFELDDSNDFELIPRNADALLDPQNVAWIECVRLVDVEGETPSIVLLDVKGLQRHSLIDMKSGECFERLEDVFLASRISSQTHRDERCYIFLRNKSKLPKWPISPDVELCIDMREGVDFSIVGGIIEVKETSSSISSRRWIYPLRKDPLEIPRDLKFHILEKQLIQYIGT